MPKNLLHLARTTGRDRDHERRQLFMIGSDCYPFMGSHLVARDLLVVGSWQSNMSSSRLEEAQESYLKALERRQQRQSIAQRTDETFAKTAGRRP